MLEVANDKADFTISEPE